MVYPALLLLMAHGEAREGKWRGNCRMQWVASTLHTTSEHGVSSITTADGTRWRMGGEVKGKLANGVGSQYPSHYLGTWCIHHYYRWWHTSAAGSRLNWRPPADLNRLVRFAERRNLVSALVPSHFNWPLPIDIPVDCPSRCLFLRNPPTWCPGSESGMFGARRGGSLLDAIHYQFHSVVPCPCCEGI